MAVNANPPTGAEVLWQEIDHLKRIITDQNSQIQRMRRFSRVDELEAVTGKLESEKALIRTVTTLSQSVQVLIDARHQELHPDLAGQILYSQNRERRSRQTARHLAYYRYLSTLVQSTTDKCPCGKHKGIQFARKDGKVVEENYCPQWWWVAMSRMSFESGRNREFHQICPLAKWLEKYVLRSLERPVSQP
jgi:hypothetical protein